MNIKVYSKEIDDDEPIPIYIKTDDKGNHSYSIWSSSWGKEVSITQEEQNSLMAINDGCMRDIQVALDYILNT